MPEETSLATLSDPPLSADRPLEDPGEDRLGYSGFARNLAEGLVGMAPRGQFVIALYGGWGSGKTTVLNFLRHYIEEEPRSADYLVVQFNPWLFSDHEELITRFLQQLLNSLERKGSKAIKRIREKAAGFAAYVGEAPSVVGSGGRVISKLLKTSEPDLHSLKTDLDALLEEAVKRIIVLVDDTDRLTASEMRQLFRMIKAVADFRNVTYVIALDPRVAVDALKEDYGERAQEYLEKIIQLPYELPLPERSALRSMFYERLDRILQASEKELVYEQERWTEVFFDSIDPFLRTPRDVSRVLNVLQASYPPVAGEVDLSDFVGMSVLKAFHPGVWDIVRRNPTSFSGHYDHTRQPTLKDFYERVLEPYPADATKIEESLKRIFPMVSAVLGGTSFTTSFQDLWRKHCRIASLEIFPLFFDQRPPDSYLSRAEIESLLRSGCDETALSSELTALAADRSPDGRTRVPAYLERLADHVDELPDECVGTALRAVLTIGEELFIREDDDPGMVGQTNERRAAWLVARLMSRLDEEERYAVLRGALTEGPGLALPASRLTMYAREHGELDGDEIVPERRSLTRDHLDDLKGALVRKIRIAAESGDLISNPDLGHLLYRWKDWGDDGEAEGWVASVIESDDALVRVLGAFLGESRSQSLDSRHVRRVQLLDPRSVANFIDPDEIIDRARKLASEAGQDEQASAALGQFVAGYDALKRGDDPTSQFA